MSKIRLQFVQVFRDRHGKTRHYFRRPGHKRVALPGLPGSTEFMEAYASSLGDAPVIEIGASKTKAGTVSALAVAYYKSAEFAGFAEDTQSMRRAIIERFRAEHGDKPVALMHRTALLKLMAKITSPHVQKNWLKTLRGVMRFAVTIGMHSTDPTDGIKTARAPKSEGHRTWGEDEIATFRKRHAIGTRARLALELLLNTAQRRSDAVRMGRQHIKD